jgi:hypothetical protein
MKWDHHQRVIWDHRQVKADLLQEIWLETLWDHHPETWVLQ